MIVTEAIQGERIGACDDSSSSRCRGAQASAIPIVPDFLTSVTSRFSVIVGSLIVGKSGRTVICSVYSLTTLWLIIIQMI